MDAVLANQDYMSALQLAFFREKLTSTKTEVLSRQVLINSEDREDISRIPDLLDRASAEEARQAALKASERDLMQLREINAALSRIESGDYGYCEKTGEEIGVRRLMAYPAARLSLEAQQLKESQNRFAGR